MQTASPSSVFDQVMRLIVRPLKSKFGPRPDFTQRRIERNKALRARMKPSDGERGFMIDPDRPSGVVVAVDRDKFLQHCGKLKSEANLNGGKIRECAKAFRANNDLHLMATVYVNDQNEIRLLEGHHRLEVLSSRKNILVNVANDPRCDETEFARKVQLVIDTCGEPGLMPVRHDKVVFCQVDFDDSGHNPFILEERVFDHYYTVFEPEKPSLAPLPGAQQRYGGIAIK